MLIGWKDLWILINVARNLVTGDVAYWMNKSKFCIKILKGMKNKIDMKTKTTTFV